MFIPFCISFLFLSFSCHMTLLGHGFLLVGRLRIKNICWRERADRALFCFVIILLLCHYSFVLSLFLLSCHSLFFSNRIEFSADGRTDGRTVGRTDGRSDGRTDGRAGGRRAFNSEGGDLLEKKYLNFGGIFY